MPATFTLTLPLQAAQTLGAFLGLLLATLILRAVIGAVATKSADLWPEFLRKTWAKWLIAIIGALFVAALLAASAVLFDTIRNVFAPPASGSSSPNLGAGALIAALLGAPFVIWGTVIKFQSLGFQREGHITDRISKAVEQLGAEKTVKRLLVNNEGEMLFERDAEGNPDLARPVIGEISEPNIEVRIGGLFSLQRIAQDSVKYDKGRDHVQMMEILCAYVRNNAPAMHTSPSPPVFGSTQLRLDIQKSVDVLKSRSAKQVQIEQKARYRLDLRRCNFDGGDFSGINLSGAELSDSRFEGANFNKADLTGTRMRGCLINQALFFDAKMIGTHFEGAKYTAAHNLFNLNCARTPLYVWIEDADMSALDFLEGEDYGYFGSKDTIVHYDYEDDKKLGLEAAKKQNKNEWRLKGGAAAQPDDLERVSRRTAPFSGWNPFARNDLTAGSFRKKFIDKHNLRGWPHDDD